MFLEWTARDLYKSWSKGTRAFVNMHTALYMYEPTAKYPVAHPRAFAACSLAGDAHLYERFCCWTCRRQVDEGEVKSLWPDMFSFTQHWHVEHASALQTEWTTLALYGSVTVQDLAWDILGVDLEETPLPRATAALPTIPKVMPQKRVAITQRSMAHHGMCISQLYHFTEPCHPLTLHLAICCRP